MKKWKTYCFVEHVDPTSAVGMNLLNDLENHIQNESLK